MAARAVPPGSRCTHNHAGFPDGISGKELLDRMKEQARRYGTRIEDGQVTRIERDEESGLFTAEWGSGPVTARTVLLATGVTNRRPPMDEAAHDDALARGLIRYCPICDGYEVTDKRVGVIGTGERGANEALFLRSYTAEVTLIAPDGPHELSEERPQASSRRRASGSSMGRSTAIEPGEETITLAAEGGRLEFDSIYPALGSDTHTQLAEMLGAALSRRRLHPRRQPPAHQRPRPLRGGRRRPSASTRSATPWAKAASPRPPSATTWRSREPMLALGEELGIEDDPLAIEAGDRVAERNERALAVRAFDLEQVAGAEILDRRDRADCSARLVDARQADQVGVIIFALVKRRQVGAVDFDQLPAQRLGGGPVGYALETGDGGLAAARMSRTASSRPPT